LKNWRPAGFRFVRITSTHIVQIFFDNLSVGETEKLQRRQNMMAISSMSLKKPSERRSHKFISLDSLHKIKAEAKVLDMACGWGPYFITLY